MERHQDVVLAGEVVVDRRFGETRASRRSGATTSCRSPASLNRSRATSRILSRVVPGSGPTSWSSFGLVCDVVVWVTASLFYLTTGK